MIAEAADFYVAFAVTLVAVFFTALLGRLARRRPHVASAVVAGALLGYSVYLAETLGRVLEIPRQILIVHLVFANSGALAFIVVIVTGVRLLTREESGRRRQHRRAIVAFIVLVVCAALTGTYMLSQATPIEIG